MSRPKTMPGTFRAIVEQVEIQYDVTWDGKPLMVWMDVLSCGHRIKSSYKDKSPTYAEGEIPLKPLDNRRCKACEKEASS